MYKVLITGIFGQDAQYMVEYLKQHDCVLHGFAPVRYRNYSNYNLNFQTISYGDIANFSFVCETINKIKPDYVINFAAQSNAQKSKQEPYKTLNTNINGALNCLEAIRLYAPKCRFFQASSSHIGEPNKTAYSISKHSSHLIVKEYREKHNIYAVNGILHNHTSPKQSLDFLPRKITHGIAKIIKSIENKEAFEPLKLYNLDEKRDWSAAEDFCDGIWRMLNQDIFNKDLKHDLNITENMFNTYKDFSIWEYFVGNIKDYVLASGEVRTIRDLCNIVLKAANIEGDWIMEGVNEKFIIANYLLDTCYIEQPVIIEIDAKLFSPIEDKILLIDTPIREELGWEPKIKFEDLIKQMFDNDLSELNAKKLV